MTIACALDSCSHYLLDFLKTVDRFENGVGSIESVSDLALRATGA